MSAAVVKAAHLWARDELDFYVEPVAATEALLRVERFTGAVWDPACWLVWDLTSPSATTQLGWLRSAP